MIAELERRPPVVMPDPPARPQRAAVEAVVGRLQVELGIAPASLVAEPPRWRDVYGPTSALSEELLMRGYGLGWPGFEGDS